MGRRRTRHRQTAGGGSGAHRQDDDAGVRVQGGDQLAAHRDHPQPVGHDQEPGRLVRRHGGGSRRRPGPGRRRHRRCRVGAHPGSVLRQRRVEAELRTSSGVPLVTVRHRVTHRSPHDERGRRGADAQRDAAPRCTGLDLAPAHRRRSSGRSRRRDRRAAHRLFPDPRVRRQRRSRGRCGGRRRCRGARRSRCRGRACRSRVRRSAGHHHRAVVHGRLDTVEPTQPGTAGRHRSRLRYARLGSERR